MNLIQSSLFCLICFFCSECLSTAQENVQPRRTTVKGRLVQNENKAFEIALDDLKTSLTEQVVLPTPDLPSNWTEMDTEQRQEWIKNFEAGEDGKKLIEERKKLMDTAHRFEVALDSNGGFTIYDVPSGNYGLRGRAEKEKDGKSYLFEVFGMIKVNEDVDEVLLDPIMVTATRLLKAGDQVPAIEIPTFDGKQTITNEHLQKKNVLINFWSMKSSPSMEFSRTIQKTNQAVKPSHNFQLLSVCVDSDRKAALEYVVANRVKGYHGFAENWDHEMLSEFGVRSIPALFLIGEDGVITMTHADFQQAFRANNDLTQIVFDAISGKTVRGSTKAESAEETGTDSGVRK